MTTSTINRPFNLAIWRTTFVKIMCSAELGPLLLIPRTPRSATCQLAAPSTSMSRLLWLAALRGLRRRHVPAVQ